MRSRSSSSPGGERPGRRRGCADRGTSKCSGSSAWPPEDADAFVRRARARVLDRGDAADRRAWSLTRTDEHTSASSEVEGDLAGA